MSDLPDNTEIPELIRSFARSGPVELTTDQQIALARYAELMAQWNPHAHFSRYRKADAILRSLVLPSIALSTILPDSGKVVDLGSGPGIPGVPLAIARPDLDITCIDSSDLAIEFVKLAIETLWVPSVRVHNGRAEVLAREEGFCDAFDIAIARSFAPLPATIEIASGFLNIGGSAVVQCAKDTTSGLVMHDSKAKRAGSCFDRVGSISVAQPDLGPVYFVVYRKVKYPYERYPRRWPLIKKRPLW
jgi:16S rRNA (guanine527-N7)-methyltransferase